MSEGAWLEAAVGLVGALLVVGFALTFGHAAALSVRGRLLAPRVAGGQRAIAAAADSGRLAPEGRARSTGCRSTCACACSPTSLRAWPARRARRSRGPRARPV